MPIRCGQLSMGAVKSDGRTVNNVLASETHPWLLLMQVPYCLGGEKTHLTALSVVCLTDSYDTEQEPWAVPLTC